MIHEQENIAASWMIYYIMGFDQKVFFDKLSGAKMVSRTNNKQIEIFQNIGRDISDYNFYYLCYPNANYQEFSFNKKFNVNGNQYIKMLKNQDLIYSNGGSQFFKQSL
jgi:hypothetical protein